jgi:hypothetical protein
VRAIRIADAAALLVLATAFVLCTYLPGGNALLQGSDFIQIFSFHKAFIRSVVTEEWTLPLWCPWSFSGHPFLADPVTQVLYPPALLWLVLPPGAAAISDAIFHFWLGGVGMRALCLTLGVSRAGAFLAAVAYMLSGFNVARAFIGHLQYYEAAAYLPWVFAYLERAVQTRRLRPLLVAAVALAMQTLTGCAPLTWITYGFSALFLLLRAPVTRPRVWRDVLAAGLHWLLFAGLATAVAAVQVFPTVELARASVRATAVARYAAQGAFAASQFGLFLFPTLKLGGYMYRWESYGYVGALIVLCAVVALRGWRSDARVRVFTLLAVCAVPLMLAGHSPLFGVLLRVVPGYGWLRAHAREALIWVLVLPVLGAIGFERARARPAGWPCVLALVLFAAGAAVYYRADDIRWWQVLVVAMAIATVGMAGRVSARTALAAAVAVLTGDLIVAARTYPTLFAMGQRIPPLEASVRGMLSSASGTGRIWLPADAARPNIGYALQRAAVGGNEGLVPGRYYAFVHAMADTPIDPGVPTVISEEVFRRRPADFPFKVLDVGWTLVRVQPGAPYKLVANPRSSGRVWLTDRWRVLPSFDAVVEAMKAPTFDARQEVLFEEHPPQAPVPGDGTIGSAHVVSSTTNSIEVSATLQRDGFLVLSETFYPGWRADIDGRPVPIMRADGVLRAVYVPQGTHRVRFTFCPTSLMIGAVTSAAALLLIALLYRRDGPLPLSH